MSGVHPSGESVSTSLITITSSSVFPTTTISAEGQSTSAITSSITSATTFTSTSLSTVGTQSSSATTTYTSSSSDTSSSSLSNSISSSTTSSSLIPSTTTSTKPRKRVEYSPGAVGGISVATAIAAALLTALIFFFIMKRKLRRESRRGKYRLPLRATSEPKPVPTSAPIEDFLLVKADDSAIQKAMQDLNVLIEQHAENYYDTKVISNDSLNLDIPLKECGYTGKYDMSANEMVSILVDPKSRLAGIRQLITRVILSHVDWKAPVKFSLLPEAVAGFCEAIPPIERKHGCEQAFEQVFAKWRHMSAFLLEPVRTNREALIVDKSQLQGAVVRNMELLNRVLLPFRHADPGSQRQQETNLSAIIFQGAELGLLLFCQPTIWNFRWNTPTRRNTGGKSGAGHINDSTSMTRAERIIVVFPALVERLELLTRGGRSEKVVSAVTVNI